MKGIVPFCTDRSEWHTPLAAMATRTSCGPVGASSMSSMTNGPPTSCTTAARTVRSDGLTSPPARARTVSVSVPERSTVPGRAPVNSPP